MMETIKAPSAQKAKPQSFTAERAMLRPRNSAIVFDVSQPHPQLGKKSVSDASERGKSIFDSTRHPLKISEGLDGKLHTYP